MIMNGHSPTLRPLLLLLRHTCPCCVLDVRLDQELKLTVSQIEIGFDVLKARQVSVAPCTTGPIRTPPHTEPSSPTKAAGESSGGDSAEREPPKSNQDEEGTRRTEDEDRRKRFRLMVKRRLLKRYGEELSSDAPTRKRQLEDLYADIEGTLLDLGTKLRVEGRDE